MYLNCIIEGIVNLGEFILVQFTSNVDGVLKYWVKSIFSLGIYT